ncbi:thiamine-binding protein [Pseudothermotoga thermarum]|uniref:Thiamine-binding protein domain-containing protein n=1 Tax=Pseudothermotoga thermarum DSM 5069 TaxID=688269 RepID=F7YVM0_9THEM|nr:thiamine-binding protein [Pseudothermotoga thermarum]AEH51681.1 protein of unknown function DUF77 [Pseudothermotoga thermarum DSM 5069]
MAKITCSIKFLPLVASDTATVYALVDEAINIIKNSGLKYLVGPSETTVEGEFEEIVELIKKIGLEMQDDCERFVLQASFDMKREGVTIDEKIRNYR